MTFKHVNIGSKQHTTVIANGTTSYNVSPNFVVANSKTGDILAELNFQDGPIKEVGINGIHNEDLIAIVMYRLGQFQESPFKSEYNQKAIDHLQAALDSLGARTKDRNRRGVEGTSKL